MDSLRAFLVDQYKNFKDDTIPGLTPQVETVKLVLDELYDPKYIDIGEFSPIDTVHSWNFRSMDKNFSAPLTKHGTYVATNAISKENDKYSRGAYNGGRTISWNGSDNR